MPRIAPINSAQADSGIQATLAAVKAKIGMVPNLFSTFAQSSAVLNGYLAFSDALAKGVLTAKQREIVALAVAQANDCEYCLSAHTLMGKGRGETAIDDAIVAFAKAVVAARGQVSDADVAQARSAGLGDGHLVEVIANVAINVMTNYTNNVAHTDIDFPKVDLKLDVAA